jgi:CDGSH-type Zn-finger protein
VQPDGASADEVAATIDTCPSGALSYTRTDGRPNGRRGYAEGADPSAAIAPDGDGEGEGAGDAATTATGESAVRVTARRNGPLVVTGPVALVGADGSEVVESRLFLCRCGGSSTKPRCDGTHKRNGFEAPGEEPTSRTIG